MDTALTSFHANLIGGWIGVFLSFSVGGLMGMTFSFFNRDWLGGYDGLQRRMYRLGHVALFAIGVVNILFYFTFTAAAPAPGYLQVASVLYLLGLISMPLCCFVIPHFQTLKLLFYIPSGCLIIAATLTIYRLLS